MDQQPVQQNVPVPGAVVAPPPPPQYIGNTGIIDRSNRQAAPPQVGGGPVPAGVNTNVGYSAPTDLYNEAASSAFAEMVVLISGVGSATGFLLITYFTKNSWATGIISAALAFTAMFFSIRDYSTTKRIGPLTVIGLSAATITVVYIANDLILRALIHSALSGY